MQTSPSAGTVAMNYAAVTTAGQSLVKYSGEISQSVSDLDTALGPVRESWYGSGSASGASAQVAEANLRRLLAEMSQIITNIGNLLSTSATDAAALDQSLTSKFASA
ncbi:WXG100 family type VII secretion target [Goodfellowiella coeruleoviolacea]|uniref:Conserved protein YukE n=1 Tax=Goodfellowiella coeruleoviolacea TaxID=334858 RepID=A0AAE3GLB8_9PSEU|nr:WXG100 family type VII secretion target [Goodfellowiella coeruleoviolacea]MCP2170155.1 putative conserved protein YukE [Goodfellowiella coeruleoviolacea]